MEQAYRVQILKPLAIGDVGLPTLYVLHVLCVDQIDFESACFQDLIDRNPVVTGRLHRHRANPALHESVGQRMQIASEGRETADRVWISIGADGDEQLTCANIDSGCIRMQDRKCITSSFAFLGHLLLRLAGRTPGARTQSKLPVEIAAGNRQTSSYVCTQPQTHALRSGF